MAVFEPAVLVEVVAVEDEVVEAAAAAPVVVSPARSDGLSGGTSRYWSAKRAICWKTGAATVPPKIAPCGSSTVTRITSRGAVAGTMPTNDATYYDVE